MQVANKKSFVFPYMKDRLSVLRDWQGWSRTMNVRNTCAPRTWQRQSCVTDVAINVLIGDNKPWSAVSVMRSTWTVGRLSFGKPKAVTSELESLDESQPGLHPAAEVPLKSVHEFPKLASFLSAKHASMQQIKMASPVLTPCHALTNLTRDENFQPN